MEVVLRITRTAILSSLIFLTVSLDAQWARQGTYIMVDGQRVRAYPGVTQSASYNADTVLYISFAGETLGTWTKDEAEDFYSLVLGVPYKDHVHTGTTDIVDIVVNGETVRALRIYHEIGELYHGYEVTLGLNDSYTDVKVRYKYLNGPNMCNVEDSKMPGFMNFLDYSYKYPEVACGCPEDSDHAWSHRPVGKDHTSKISGYGYDFTDVPPNDQGGCCPWGYQQDSVYLLPGTPYDVVQYLHMNTYAAGFSLDDAFCEYWIDGDMALQQTGISLHDFESDTTKINAFKLSTFTGGDDTISNSPQRDGYTYVWDVLLYTDEKDDPNWGGLHPTNEKLIYPGSSYSSDFYVDSTIDNESEDLTSPGYPSNTGPHINYRWLIDAGVGNTANVVFDFGDNIYGSRGYLAFYEGETSDSRLIGFYDGTISDLSSYTFNSDPGVVQSSTRYLYVCYVTGYYGSGNQAGGSFQADVVFNWTP